VVECANDPAITEALAPTDRVAAPDLVPFDNTLALRDLLATPWPPPPNC
jgi:hypothetical protein